mgnify:CR=1 FL=1
MPHEYDIDRTGNMTAAATVAMPQVPSELSPSESRGPTKVVAAVATASLPVVEAAKLHELSFSWRIRANGVLGEIKSKKLNRPQSRRRRVIAIQLLNLADELDQLTAASTERQPEENIASETRGPLATNAENGQSPRCL